MLTSVRDFLTPCMMTYIHAFGLIDWNVFTMSAQEGLSKRGSAVCGYSYHWFQHSSCRFILQSYRYEFVILTRSERRVLNVYIQFSSFNDSSSHSDRRNCTKEWPYKSPASIESHWKMGSNLVGIYLTRSTGNIN